LNIPNKKSAFFSEYIDNFADGSLEKKYVLETRAQEEGSPRLGKIIREEI